MGSQYESPEFYDVGRIVNPDSPEGRVFADFMTDLTKRLLGKNYNAEKYGFRFMLADESSSNAYTIPSARPPLIVIHKGLMQNARSLDELAGVVAHEVGHILAEQEFGGDKAGNSKAEEMGADLHAVKLLADAGFNAQGLEDFLNRLDSKDAELKTRLMTALYDVHPLTDNRASAMEKARILLNREGYKTDSPRTPVPKSLLDLAAGMEFHSETDIPARARRDNFDGMSFDEKLEWMNRQVELTKKLYNYGYDKDAKIHYGRQIRELFGNIELDSHDLSQKAKYEAFFTDLVKSGLYDDKADFAKLYEATLKALGEPEKQPYKPIGIFKDFGDLINEFRNAGTEADAIVAADKLNSLYNEIKPFSGYPGEVRGYLDYGTIEAPTVDDTRTRLEKGPVEFPFLKHHEWIEQNKNPSLYKAMSVIFGDHYNIKDMDGVSGKPPLIRGNYPVDQWTYSGHYNKYLGNFIHSEGRITALLPEPLEFPSKSDWEKNNKRDYKKDETHVESLLARETDYLNARATWENDLLKKGIPWHLMKDDPDLFFRIYEKAIQPIHTFQPYDHPFAHAMLDYIHDEAKSHPRDMTPQKRAELLTRVTGIHAEGKGMRFYFDKEELALVRGINPDHPYVQELLWLKNRNLSIKENLLFDIRHNPFSAIDTLPLTRADVFPGNGPGTDAHTIQDIRDAIAPNGQAQDIRKLVRNFDSLNTISDKHATSNERKAEAEALKKGLHAKINSSMELLKNMPSEDLIHQYIELDRSRLMGPLPELRERWSNLIIDRVEATTEPREREALLRRWMDYKTELPEDDKSKRSASSYRDKQSYTAPSPDVRRRLVGVIVGDLVKSLGKDNETQVYADQVDLKLKGYREITSGSIRAEIISGFADASEAQPELAARLKKLWVRDSAVQASRQDMFARVGEAGITAIKSKPEKRVALLEFLSRPLSAESLEAVHSQMDVDTETSKIFDPARTGGSRNKDTEMQMLKEFHTEFWEAPMPARAAFLNDYLFPDSTNPKATDHVTGRVLDRIMGSNGHKPLKVSDLVTLQEHLGEYQQAIADNVDKDGSPKNKYERVTIFDREVQRQHLPVAMLRVLTEHLAEDIPRGIQNIRNRFGIFPDRSAGATGEETVRSYLTAIKDQDPAEARLLVSALMGADHARAPGEQMRMGQTLHLVLSQMGPAGAKLLQAIHSHPSTPEDIRADLKYAKIAHDKPYRWNAIEMLQETGLLATDGPQRVTHVGPVIGAGSFGITMRNQTATGEYADTLLRPRALAKATREFDFMLDASRMLANRDPRMLPVLDMIGEAEHAARIETRMSLAAKQNELAMQSYDGVKVTIPTENGPQTFTHRVAPLHGIGDQYKRVDIAPGVHFLEMPGNPALAVQRQEIHPREREQIVLNPISRLTAVADEVTGSEAMKIIGVGNVSLPDERHQSITDAVREVAARMKIPSVNVLVHDGDSSATAYMLDHDTLMVAAKSTEMLTPDELRALITHELDHKLRADDVRAITEKVAALATEGKWEEFSREEAKLRVIRDDMEFSADRRAAEYYGASNMKSALIKLVAHASGSMELPIRVQMFNETDPEKLAGLTPQDVAARMQQVANGEAETMQRDMNMRLRFLQGIEGAQVEAGKYKSATAQAMVAGQLSIRLAGMPVDRDRHGGNVKIEGNTINHFDFGMQEVLPPTDAQKAALGKVVGQAVKDTRLKGGDFSTHLIRRIDNLTTSNDVQHFLAGFKREILSLGDYMNALSHDGTQAETTAKLTGILGHAMYGEAADPVIQGAFRKQLGVMSGQAEKTLRQAATDSGIQIDHVRKPETLRIPELSPAEFALLQAPEAALPKHLITSRQAVQSGVGNGFGVAMGAYGLYHKFGDKESFYQQDIQSGDQLRRASAVTGVALDVSNIAAGAVATASDVHTIRTARAKPAEVPHGGTTQPRAAASESVAGRAAGETGKKVGKSAVEAIDDVAKIAAQTLDEAAKGAEGAAAASRGAVALRVGGRVAGRAFIPLAVATGGVETYTATRAGDRDRAAGAIGGTAGGILGGIAAGAAAGALMGGAAGSVVPGIGTIAVGVVAGIGGGLIGAFAGEAASKKFLAGAVGWVTGVDGKFEEAMKGLDQRLLPFLDKNGDKKRDVEDIHRILQSAGLDSIDKIDKNHDGKLSAAELNTALAGVIIDKELTEKLAELNNKGWGGVFGNKDGKMTLAELKTALPKGMDIVSLDKDHNGDISGREITDALNTARHAVAAPTPPKPKSAPVATRH